MTTWEAEFRALLYAKGYDYVLVRYDPAHGWEIHAEAHGSQPVEVEGRTTVIVRERIEALGRAA